jgi:hypothetical protein
LAELTVTTPLPFVPHEGVDPSDDVKVTLPLGTALPA